MQIKSKFNNQCTQKPYIFQQPIQFQTDGYFDRLLPILHFTKIRLHVMLLLIYFCVNPVNTEFSNNDSNIFQNFFLKKKVKLLSYYILKKKNNEVADIIVTKIN